MHESGLHADEAAHAGVAALEFLRHQSVFDVAHAGAAVAFERRAEEAEIGHGLDQFARKAAGAVALFDDGNEIVFDELARGVAHQALFFGEQRIELDEIDTAKFDGRHDGISVGRQTYDGSRGEGAGSTGASEVLPFESRDPARDGPAVLFVRGAEFAAEGGFFVEDDENIEGEADEGGILRKPRSAKQSGFAEHYKQHADVHGIAHIAVQRGDDEELRGSDGRGRAQTAHSEFPRTAKIDAGSQDKTEQAEPGQGPVCRRRHSIEQEVGSAYRYESWNEDRE